MEQPPDHGRLPLWGGVLMLAALTALPLGLYAGHHRSLTRLAGSLAGGLGLRVRVADIWVDPGGDLVFQRVAVGDRRLGLTADRVEAEVDLTRLRAAGGARSDVLSTLERVRLVRPRLTFSGEAFARWVAPASPPNKTPNRGGQARPRPSASPSPGGSPARSSLSARIPRILVVDGSVDASFSWGGRPVRLTVGSVQLRSSGRNRRLLLGKVALRWADRARLTVDSAAVELDPRRGYLPLRMAGTGGTLSLGRDRSPVVTVLRAEVRRLDRGYRVTVVGQPSAGDRGGMVRVDLLLQPRQAPHVVSRARLTLDRVPLSALGRHTGLRGVTLDRAVGHGVVSVDRRATTYGVTVDLKVTDARVTHPLLSPGPVSLSALSARGALDLDPAAGLVQLRRLSLVPNAGKVRAVLDGWIRRTGGTTRADLRLEIPKVACQTALYTLPDLVPRLRGMVLRGDVGLRAWLKMDSRRMDEAEVDARLDPLTCAVLVDPPRADVTRLRRKVPRRAEDNRGWILGPRYRSYLPMARISRHVRAAFLAAEDNRFYQHNGFDGRLLRRAFLHNIERGKLVRGASTISQQLVKNLFLYPDRDIARKLQEAVLTWRLEQRVGKDRILEAYLNLVEMGPGIHGVAQAARHYFGKEAEALNPLEAAHLAALTPSPVYFARKLDRKNPSRAWMERLHMILRLMRRNGAITDKQLRRWTEEDLMLTTRK